MGLAVAIAGALAVTAVAANLIVTSDRLTTTGNADPATSTCSPAAVDDAYVDESSQNSNFGSASTLQVASRSRRNRRTYLRFDIAGCGIPSGSTVISANLGLVVTTVPSSARVYGLHTVDSTFSWTESGITWTSQSSSPFNETPMSSQTVGTSSAGTVVGWDVRSDVQVFATGGRANNGWVVRDLAESQNPATEVRFGSAESAQPPTLTITYTN